MKRVNGRRIRRREVAAPFVLTVAVALAAPACGESESTPPEGTDPTTPSTDHSREHALLLAYAAGKNAAGRVHEDGEFGDVGATICAWLGAKHPGKGAPGRPILER